MDKIKKIKVGKQFAEKMLRSDAAQLQVLGMTFSSIYTAIITAIVVLGVVFFVIEMYISIQSNSKQTKEEKRKPSASRNSDPERHSVERDFKSSPFASPAAFKQAGAKRGDSSPLKEKQVKIDTSDFICKLTAGLDVNKYRAPESKKSTDKRKSLRLKRSGELYWHKEGGIHFSKPETWSLKELSSCFLDAGQQKTGGEVFLTFVNPKTKAEKLLEFVIEDSKQRSYAVSAFQRLIEQLQHEADFVMKVVEDACDGNLSASSSPQGEIPFPTSFPSSPGKNRNLHILTGDPSKTRNHDSRSSYQGDGTIDANWSPTAPVTPGKGKYDVCTDLHSLSNKELAQAIKQEHLDDSVVRQRDRHDLIKALAVHYKNKNREACGLPVVEVKEDFYNQIRVIYEQIKPEKIKDIPEILEIWKGREDQLLEELIHKYDIKEEHHHLLTPSK